MQYGYTTNETVDVIPIPLELRRLTKRTHKYGSTNMGGIKYKEWYAECCVCARNTGHCICKWCDGDGIYTETPIDFKYDDEDAKERKYQTYNKRLNRARRKGNPDLPVKKRKKKESGIINHRENNDQAERLITIDNAAEIYDDENAQDKPEQTQPVERTPQTQPHVEEQAVNDDYH